jgi:hypothetical protein
MKRSATIISVCKLMFICASVISCSWAAANKDSTLITKNGIVGLIEIDMTIRELSSNNFAYEKKPSPFRKPGQVIYAVRHLGFEFETYKDIVVRIWFFAEKNREFKILMPRDGAEKALVNIMGKEIVKNYGAVKKYVNQNPPKDKKEAVWVKYQPFGIPTNTINYPDSPFHFGLNWDDTLAYITVSKLE